MFAKETYIQRRALLKKNIGSGVLLFLGDVYKRQVFTLSVGMVALCDKYHFRVVFQSGNYFVVQSHIGDKQKFQ